MYEEIIVAPAAWNSAHDVPEHRSLVTGQQDLSRTHMTLNRLALDAARASAREDRSLTNSVAQDAIG